LTVSVATDWAGSYSQSNTFTFTSAPTFNEETQLTLAQQKCESIRIKVSDGTAGSPSSYAAANFSGIAIDYKPKSGAHRIPSNQSA
jgi:hypothetical protein